MRSFNASVLIKLIDVQLTPIYVDCSHKSQCLENKRLLALLLTCKRPVMICLRLAFVYFEILSMSFPFEPNVARAHDSNKMQS